MKQAFHRLFQPEDDPAPEREAARQRYRQAMQNPHWSSDMPIKMFNDIDILLFRGDLRRRVNVKWDSFRAISICQQPDQILGFTMPPNTSHAPRVKIRLNTDQDWARLGKRALLGTLAHEMLHAYFFIHCGVSGYHDLVTVPGMDSGHGFYFTRAAELMEVHSGLKML